MMPATPILQLSRYRLAHTQWRIILGGIASITTAAGFAANAVGAAASNPRYDRTSNSSHEAAIKASLYSRPVFDGRPTIPRLMHYEYSL